MEKSEKDEAIETLNVLQPMISLSAERLDGLRTQCATSAEITQQEIRTLEGKLIKLFSNQLVAKKRIPPENLAEFESIPSLRLWLQVVGLDASMCVGICSRVSSLESLKEHPEVEVRSIMNECHANDEEVRRLTRALNNLKRYTDALDGSIGGTDNLELYWDSWDMQKVQGGTGAQNESSSHHHHHHNQRGTRSSVPSEEYVNQNYHHNSTTTPCTPVSTLAPSSSLNSPSSFSSGSQSHHNLIYSPTNTNSSTVSVFSPSSPHHQHIDKSSIIHPEGSLQPDNFPLTKSKSHESQLANRIECTSEVNLASIPTESQKMIIGNRRLKKMVNYGMGRSLERLAVSGGKRRRDRLPTEPGPGTGTAVWDSIIASPVKSPPSVSHTYLSSEVSDDLDSNGHKSTSSLSVPKSPRTPTLARSMGHMISHRFTKMFKMSTCDYCFKQVIIGLKCKECKFKCHRDCEPKVPPSCGLPPGFISVFVQSLKLQSDGHESPLPPSRFSNTSTSSSPGQGWGRRDRKITRAPANMHIQPFSGPDSSSNTSSCNSSTPSSPAPFAQTATSTTLSTQSNPSSSSAFHPNQTHLFNFPDIGERGDIRTIGSTLTSMTHTSNSTCSSEFTSTEKSNDSDRTVSQTSSSGHTVGTPSSSTDSEKTIALRVDSQDSQGGSDGDGANDRSSWPRQNSLSNREWDIPFDELKMGDKIGTGHFGTVYRGNWHGDVAIKVLDMRNYLDNEKTLEQFKVEVGIFRKTRHENLVLFMGACMKPPRLAIVTSMCKGNSLHTHLHLRKDKFNINKTVLVAQQISQGMGYLHARGIVHKDLKTRNIFLESGKVVITDFGLFSVTKLCQASRNGDRLSIPQGWLPYLAPEIMKNLRVSQKNDSELPFSKASDTYAFGTVWYELLCGEFPYTNLPTEAIIWQVGSGIRQPLPTLFSRDVKDILLMCWSSRPEDRLDFGRLLKTLEKLPKKRLARSPSHPVHLSRSAESVF